MQLYILKLEDKTKSKLKGATTNEKKTQPEGERPPPYFAAGKL